MNEKSKKLFKKLVKLLNKNNIDNKKLCKKIFKLITLFYEDSKYLYNKKESKYYKLIKYLVNNDKNKYLKNIFIKIKNILHKENITYNNKTFINLCIEYLFNKKNYLKINDYNFYLDDFDNLKDNKYLIKPTNIPSGIFISSSKPIKLTSISKINDKSGVEAKLKAEEKAKKKA